MFGFFYSIYMALLNGEWVSYTATQAGQELGLFWGDLTSWLMNCLGGEFATVQTAVWQSSPFAMLSLVLAVTTMTLVCWAVWRLTKALFSIFFARVR